MSRKLTLNRRNFLKAGALLAPPFILPSRIWAAETGPNSRINLGFIGVGKQNRGLLGNFIRRNEVQVLAVCDVDQSRREDAKRRRALAPGNLPARRPVPERQPR